MDRKQTQEELDERAQHELALKNKSNQKAKPKAKPVEEDEPEEEESEEED